MFISLKKVWWKTRAQLAAISDGDDVGLVWIEEDDAVRESNADVVTQRAQEFVSIVREARA